MKQPEVPTRDADAAIKELANVLLALFCVMTVKHPTTRVRMDSLDSVYLDLQQRFPKQLPHVVVTSRMGPYVYARSLNIALQYAIRMGIDVCNPMFQYLRVDEAQASTMLDIMRSDRGSAFIADLEPVADALVEASEAA